MKAGEAKTPTDAAAASLEAELRELRERIRLTEMKLEGIQQIGQILASDLSLDAVLSEVVRRTTALMGCERATLFLMTDDDKTLWSKVAAGGALQTIELPVGSGIAGWVAAHGRSVNVKDAYRDARFDAAIDLTTGYRTRSILCHPLRNTQQRIVGVLQALNKAEGYFTPADEGLLGAIASQAAVCIQNSKLYLDVVTKNIALFDTQLVLKERTAEIELLYNIERAASLARSLDEALDGALAHTLAEFPCDVAAILLHDPRRDALVVRRAAGPFASWMAGKDIPRHEPFLGGDVGDMLASGQPAAVADPGELARIPALFASAPPEMGGLASLAFLPIARAEEPPLGCLVVVNAHRVPRGFADRDLHKLGVVASRMALSIVLAQAQDEERKAERLAAVGGALSGVVHDIRTPLTIIGGYARMMEREPDQAVRHAHRDIVKKQIDQIGTMIHEVLGFARGKSEVLLRKVWVREFVTDVEAMFRAELAETPIRLAVEITYRGAVRMDPAKMQRVMTNLARNAREAMMDAHNGHDAHDAPRVVANGPVNATDTGPATALGLAAAIVSAAAPASESPLQLRLEVAESEGRVLFRVSDTGPGIPPEMQGRLFESFASHGKRNGTGLGLAIVKKIVDEHEGTLEVSSTPGHGTTFTIGLPTA